MRVLEECATSTPIWSLGFKLDRTRLSLTESESVRATAKNILVLCFCLSVSLCLLSLRRQAVVGTWACEVQFSLSQLNGFSFHWLSLHDVMQPYTTQACSPLTITQHNTEFLTHLLVFSGGSSYETFWQIALENDYFWMQLCFCRYYSYHHETGRNEGAANAALDVILQILDILSHPLWER